MPKQNFIRELTIPSKRPREFIAPTTYTTTVTSFKRKWTPQGRIGQVSRRFSSRECM